MTMLHASYPAQTCSVAGALELVGERWTLLVIRDVFLGLHRFDALQAELGVARNVLASRLGKLVDAGILDRVAYRERPVRHEYRLTAAGVDLWPVVVSLMQWGDAHAAPAGGPAVVLTHRDCGGHVDGHRLCTRCGARIGPRDVRAAAGPGAGPDHPLRRVP